MDEAGHRLRVLVVDDDRDFLSFIRGSFPLESKITVEAVATPLEAMWLLERGRFDVVISDLLLGSTDGAHLLEEVHARWPETARVLVTGHGDHLRTREVMPAAQAVLLKPLDSGALRDLLAALPRPRRRTSE